MYELLTHAVGVDCSPDLCYLAGLTWCRFCPLQSDHKQRWRSCTQPSSSPQWDAPPLHSMQCLSVTSSQLYHGTSTNSEDGVVACNLQSEQCLSAVHAKSTVSLQVGQVLTGGSFFCSGHRLHGLLVTSNQPWCYRSNIWSSLFSCNLPGSACP